MDATLLFVTTLSEAWRWGLGDEQVAVYQVVAPLEPIRQEALRSAFLIGAASLVALIVGGILLGVTLRRSLTPLQELAATARSTHLQSLDMRVVEPETDDEVGALAREFNHMLERLQAASDQQRTFMASVSHELRTPITIARGHLELLTSKAFDDPAARAETVEILEEELARMGRLVEDLFAIATYLVGSLIYLYLPLVPEPSLERVYRRNAEALVAQLRRADERTTQPVDPALPPDLAPAAPAQSGRLAPDGPAPEEASEAVDRFSLWTSMVGIILVVVTVLGGIWFGFFTPTEAGAVGVFVGALTVVYRFHKHRVLGFLRTRLGLPVTVPHGVARLSADPVDVDPTMMRAFKQALVDTTRVVGLIFAILIGAALFSRFVSLSRIPYHFSEFVGALDQPPLVILALVLLLYIPLGMFLNPLSVMVITVPITLPVVTNLGYSPIWYGIIVIKMMEIAAITPPVGLNVYVAKGVAPHIPLEDIFRGIAWFFVMDLLTIMVLVAFPEIILFLPDLMF